jgi:hypothetical protein
MSQGNGHNAASAQASESRPWVVHPFSLTPTINWIEGRRAGWWAPCIWCALGVAALVGGEVRVHTRYGAGSEPLTIPVTDGKPVGFEDLVIHFAIPLPGLGTTCTNTARWCCRSALPVRSRSGATGIGCHVVRLFHRIRWRISQGSGTVSCQSGLA